MSSIKQLEDIIFSVNQINKSLLDDLLTLKEDKKLTNNQLNAALTAKEKAERKYEKIKNEIEVLRKSSEDFEAKCSELELELHQLKQILKDKEDTLLEITNENSHLKQENTSLSKDRSDLQEQFELLSVKMTNMVGKEVDRGLLDKELRELKEHCQQLENDKTKFDKLKSEVEKKRIEAEKYAFGLEKRANELEELLSSGKSSHQKDIDQLQNEIQTLNKENAQLKTEINDFDTLLKNEQSNREQIEQESSQIKSKQKKSDQSYEEKLNKLQQQYDQLSKDYQNSKLSYQEQIEKLNDLVTNGTNESGPIDITVSKEDIPMNGNGNGKISNSEYNKLLKKNEELTVVNQTLDAKIDEFLKKYESEKKLRIKIEDQLLLLQNQINGNNSTSPTNNGNNKLSFSSFFTRSPIKTGSNSSIDHQSPPTSPPIEVVDVDTIISNINESGDSIIIDNVNSNNNNNGLDENSNNISEQSPTSQSQSSTPPFDEEIGKELKSKVFKIYQDMLVECNTILYAKQELLVELEKVGKFKKIFQITTVKSSISKIEPIQEAIKKFLHLIDSKPFLTPNEEQIENNRIKLLQTDLDAEKS